MDEFQIIPKEQWQHYCDSFEREHRGWLMRIWVVDTGKLEAGLDDDTDMIVRDHVLEEMALEEHSGRTEIAIIVRKGESHTSHLVRRIASLSVETDAEGKDSGLRIDTAEGRTTLLRFRKPVDPKSPD